MDRSGIAPLCTTIALAFTSGSSTTSQRPTPKKSTMPRINPPQTAESISRARERDRRTVAGFFELAMWQPAHAIPPHRSGQSSLWWIFRRMILALSDRQPHRLGNLAEHSPLAYREKY